MNRNSTKSHFHFIGVGGVGMCGIAELLLDAGARVSGSDLNDNANTQRLKKKGAQIFLGHHQDHVKGADVVVFSTAVPETNPEMIAARAHRIPLIHRAEALAEVMRLKRGVAVAGTHGKTTTTSMVSSIFLQAQLEPTVFVGGRFHLIDSTAQSGKGEWFLAEADESDGSFRRLQPEIAIITNIDSDHLDYFKTFENLQAAFYDFALSVSFYGRLIVCGDDPRVRELFRNYPKRISFYGFDEKNDYVLKGEKGHYEIFEKNLGEIQTGSGAGLTFKSKFHLELPGKHNALNALGAMICALQAGVSFEVSAAALEKFQGADRRFQWKGAHKGVDVYDDYGHHPTEIRCVLQAFREKFENRRLVVCFQPHRYSRTESCWGEFLSCFKNADLLYILDIYEAGERPLDGVHSMRLTQEIHHENKIYLPKDKPIVETIRDELKPGDVFVTLGAGDGWKIGAQIVEKSN